jgi:hypothetical protein
MYRDVVLHILYEARDEGRLLKSENENNNIHYIHTQRKKRWSAYGRGDIIYWMYVELQAVLTSKWHDKKYLRVFFVNLNSFVIFSYAVIYERSFEIISDWIIVAPKWIELFYLWIRNIFQFCRCSMWCPPITPKMPHYRTAAHEWECLR